MRHFISKSFVCSLILSSASGVFSQAKDTEKRLSDTHAGYSFSAPAGFDSKQNEEGFGLTNTEKSVVIAVKNHAFKSFDEFSAQSNLEKDGFSPVGTVQAFGKNGKTFLVARQTAQGILTVNTFLLFSPHGGGTVVVAFSEKENDQAAFRAARLIAESVKFTRPQISRVASQWQTLLRGKHLLYLYTASGFSERTDIYLCPSGGFIYRSDSSSLSNNGSGVVASNSDGNWRISGSGESLILQFVSGAVREYKISRRQAGNEIGLNGNRYFVQSQNQCR